jgi:hypothetical protein
MVDHLRASGKKNAALKRPRIRRLERCCYSDATAAPPGVEVVVVVQVFEWCKLIIIAGIPVRTSGSIRAAALARHE